MSSTKPAISPAALALVLDAMESVSPATVKALSEAAELGQTTVARAAALCRSRGVLAYRKSTDPVSGRPCRALVPATGLLLPILTITGDTGIIRAVNMGLKPVGTAVTELDPTAPPEEVARLLTRRCLALLRGLGGSGHVTSPILLAEPSPSARVLREAVADTLGVQPLVVMSRGEAVARSMTVKERSRKDTSLLFLSVSEEPHACLLLRGGNGRWMPSSLGENLTHTLSRALHGTVSSAEALRRGTAVFLTDLCRFLRPDRIWIEDPRRIFSDSGMITALLPWDVEVTVASQCDGLSVAEEGAALAGRRMLWEQILLA
jgi:hypothetical protein